MISTAENARQPSSINQGTELIADPDAHELLMRDAVWKHLEAQIANMPEVLNFHSELKRLGKPLFQNRDEAWDFLQTDIIRILSFEQLEHGGYAHRKDETSVLELPPELIDDSEQGDDKRPYHYRVLFDEHHEEVAFDDSDILRLENRSNQVIVNNFVFSGIRLSETETLNSKAKQFLENTVGAELQAVRGSVSGQALEIAYTITQDLYIDPQDALVALLTNQLPPPRLIDYRSTSLNVNEVDGTPAYRSYGPIRLEIQPWLSAEIVAKKFREVQTELLGGENRPVSPYNIALFRFVSEASKAGEKIHRLAKLWNKEQVSGSGDCEQDEVGESKTLASTDFWKAYRRVRRKLFPETKWSVAERFENFFTESLKEFNKTLKEKLPPDPDFTWNELTDQLNTVLNESLPSDTELSWNELRDHLRSVWKKDESKRRRI